MTLVQKIMVVILSALTAGVLLVVVALAVSQWMAPPAPAAPSAAQITPAPPTAPPTEVKTASPSPSPLATATPVPPPTYVVRSAEHTGVQCTDWAQPQQFVTYEDDAGVTHFVGEPQNKSNQSRQGAVIVIQLFNKEAQYVGSTSAPLLLDVVPAGESAPYNVTLARGFPEWQSYTLAFECAPPGAERIKSYNELQILSQADRAGKNSSFTIDGQIKNNGQGMAHTVQVVGVLYDENGLVINAARADARPDSLKPGEAASFEIVFETVKRAVTRSRLLFQARGE